MSKRKPPKNLRPYATPSGKKARMVEVTDSRELAKIKEGMDEGYIGVPWATVTPGDRYFVSVDDLHKWRASQTTSEVRP
jgi:hypothetical protein